MRSTTVAAVAVVALIGAACSSDGDSDDTGAATTIPASTDDSGASERTAIEGEDDGTTDVVVRTHADALDAMVQLLPPGTRSVTAVDIGSLGDGPAAAWFDGASNDPAMDELFETIARFVGDDFESTLTTVLIGQTTDPALGQFLLASLTADGRSAVEANLADSAGNWTVFADGVVAIGADAIVEHVAAAIDGAGAFEGELAPYLSALSSDDQISSVHGLPALYGTAIEADRTLRSASAMSGNVSVVDGEVVSTVAFHTANAEDFVESYNALNRAATQGENPIEQPLELADPLVDDLGRVVVTVPPVAVDASFEDVRLSRNIFKKLLAGMEAFDYAEDVVEGGNAPWLDFVVKSEQDPSTPQSPGSVYIRWEFKDQAAIEAFEANELPEGFRLAPTSFLESDDPEGEYFFALNLYNAAGGSIVTGARAEWDVFVHGPDGADPNAGERPRFQVVDVLAEEVSADPGNLLTSAEPLSHELIDGDVVSTVQRTGADGEVIDVFSTSFPVPDPATADVARFTREMAIGNDYIYWAHGVSDRVLYNATTFNHDAYFVDVSQLEFVDNSRWADYLKPEVMDAVYYVNNLEYVASPMANLASDHLDLTPEWLDELRGFRNNGHQRGLMRTAVELLFKGTADPFVGEYLSNDTPATYYNFTVTDPEGFEENLDLPPGHTLAPTSLFVDTPAEHHLTLAVYEIDGSMEGVRAEWIVYTDDGSGRPPGMLVIELVTEDVAFDPVTIVNSPSVVEHGLADSQVTTRLASSTVTVDATAGLVSAGGSGAAELSLDWIEAGDIVCHLNDICDKHYYDAETLDVAVGVATDVVVDQLSTPWDAFIDTTPAVVFFRDNAQQYATQHWFNLDVPFDDLPFTGLDDPTHTISGSGALTGRSSDLVNSDYAYTGDAILDGDQLTFAIDQQINNALGEAHIFTSGVFDITTGTGSQTVIDCIGPALMCSDVENGTTGLYTTESLEVAETAISWNVDAVVDLGGTFGIADSASSFVAEAMG